MFIEKSRHSQAGQEKNSSKKKARGRLWRQFVIAIIVFQLFNYGLKMHSINGAAASEAKPGDESGSNFSLKSDAKIQDRNTTPQLNYYFE